MAKEISDIFKKFTDLEEKRDQEADKLQQQRIEKQTKLAEVEKTILEAGKAGDLDRFMNLNKEKDIIISAMNVLTQRYETLISFGSTEYTADEIRKTWDSYVGDLNKQIDDGFRKYEAAKKALLVAFSSLIDLQKEMIIKRRQLLGVQNRCPKIRWKIPDLKVWKEKDEEWLLIYLLEKSNFNLFELQSLLGNAELYREPKTSEDRLSQGILRPYIVHNLQTKAQNMLMSI